MASVQITHVSDSRANITANKRASMLCYDQTNYRLVWILNDATTERDVLLFDSNMDALSSVGTLLIKDDGVIGLSSVKGRIVFNDTPTPDSISIVDAELIINSASAETTLNDSGITFDSFSNRTISIEATPNGRDLTVSSGGCNGTAGDGAGDLNLKGGDCSDVEENIGGGDVNITAGNAPMSYEAGVPGDVNITAGSMNGSIAGSVNIIGDGLRVEVSSIVLDLGGDIYNDGDNWQNYAGTSTITGWSGTPTATIYYKKVGRLIHCQFNIAGTSDASTGATASFTLPYTNNSNVYYTGAARVMDNGTWKTTPGRIWMNASNATVNVYSNFDGAGYTTSGTKTIQGSFSYMS